MVNESVINMRAFVVRVVAIIAVFGSTAIACGAQEGFPTFQQPGETVEKPVEAAQMRWRLENSFRLFRKPSSIAVHRQIYRSLGKIDRENSPVLSAETKLQAQSGVMGWAHGEFRHTCFSAGSASAPECKNYFFPASHRVIVEISGKFDDDTVCDWTLSDRRHRVIRRARSLCRKAQLFDIPYPGGGIVEARNRASLVARQVIRVEDILVVGLGDSIGSGEGNPDAPVRFDDTKALSYGRVMVTRLGLLRWPTQLSGYPRRAGEWERLFEPGFDKAGAGWLDQQCHRSLYSYQARAAMQLAVENDQRAVTFLSLACTGADTLEGIFLPATVRECIPDKPTFVQSQLNGMVSSLCPVKPQETALPNPIASLLNDGKSSDPAPLKILSCPEGQPMRKPDLVLVSLGGNDIGFSEMVADAILHRRSFYRELARNVDSVHGPEQGTAKLKTLPKRYEALARTFETLFATHLGAQRNVLITSYPDMGYGADGKTICKGSDGMEVFPAFSLDEKRATAIEELSTSLHTLLQTASKTNGWTLVDSHRDIFRPHGLCAQPAKEEASDVQAMPFYNNKKWKPFKPNQYRPYASRQRWVRTPNDAFMTVNYHQQAFGRAKCSNLGSLVYNPFQLFLAGTYGGAFHPTAEGHAAMADAVVKQARDVLKSKRVAAAR